MAEGLWIRTARVLARPAQADPRDLRFLREFCRDPELVAPLGIAQGHDVDEVMLARQVAEAGSELLGAVLIVESLDGARIGQARLGRLDAAGSCEIEISLLPGARQFGYAEELERAMRRFLFENTRCSSVRRRVLDTEAGGARAEGSTELDREAWLRLQLGGEAASIVPEAAPVTKAQITAKLQELGVEEGGLLLLHASLSALGWVCGGEYALLQGVLEALGPEGTVIVATQSSYNSDPSQWQAPAVPKTWWPVIRAEMPAFDPARSPSRGMGRVAELLRSWPGAFRSSHPAVSFAGLGPMAEELLSEHPLDHPLGEDSPLARLYQEDADLLLLGCGYESCTAFHLAEHRAGIREIERAQAAVLIDGQRRWVAYEQIDYDSSIFPELGAAFESASALAQGQLGQAELKLFAMRAAVDFASDHFRQRC